MNFKPADFIFFKQRNNLLKRNVPTVGGKRKIHLFSSSYATLLSAEIYALMLAPIISVETPRPE